ncbi:MAG: hypothetical protein JST54_13500 [Deltaproteobacteria bacterium]|nr:hypothetical protein [Deltaproteobacteria bacterium]
MNRTHLRILILVMIALAVGCRTTADVQRDYAQTFAPAEVQAAPSAAAGMHDVKLRIWVDQEYRAHVIGWPDKVRELVERANTVVGPAYGIHFVPELRNWTREREDADLERALEDLEKLDPGQDVGWVLGLTGVLGVATPNIHDIGRAELYSKHMVEHAMDDAAEGQAFDRAFTALSQDERLKLYRDRMHHKELVVFLHEWAHTLGAAHTRILSDLLYPAYDNSQTAFGPPNAEILQQNLAERLRDANAVSTPAARAVVLKALQRDGCPACDPADLPKDLAAASINAAPAPALAPAPAPKADALTESERAQANDALALASHGDALGAWPLVDGLAKRHPNLVYAQELACNVGVRAPSPVDGRPACQRWQELAPKDGRARLGLALAEDSAGARGAAATRLVDAEELLALDAAVSPAVWSDADWLGRKLQVLTAVDRAAPHLESSTAAKEASWSTHQRRRLGLPPDASPFQVEPAQEPEYAAQHAKASDALAHDQLATAQRTIDGALARWPGAPGLLGLRCQLREARNQLDAARADCEAALKAWPDAVWPHFDLGLMALDRRDLETAQRQLTRVTELDPTIKSAWRNLLQIASAQRRADEVERLRNAYKEVFGEFPPASGK